MKAPKIFTYEAFKNQAGTTVAADAQAIFEEWLEVNCVEVYMRDPDTQPQIEKYYWPCPVKYITTHRSLMLIPQKIGQDK